MRVTSDAGSPDQWEAEIVAAYGRPAWTIGALQNVVFRFEPFDADPEATYALVLSTEGRTALDSRVLDPYEQGSSKLIKLVRKLVGARG
jgi:hypothetical protein